MSSILKYAFFFGTVFVIFMSIAVAALLHSMSASVLPVGVYCDYNDDIPGITIFQNKMGFWDHGKLCKVEGHWTDNIFFAQDSPGAPVTVAARALPNEDLEIHMTSFHPQDSRILTAVKVRRMPYDHYPYPIIRKDSHPDYPPPKGLIKPGMLEADLAVLPWQPYARVQSTLPPFQSEGTVYGTNVANGWPRTWCYRSDDPHLPGLRVLVAKGRVTEVSGGAEDTNQPAWTPPPDADSESNIGEPFWVRYFVRPVLRLFFGR